MKNLEKYVENLKEAINFIHGADVESETTRKTIRRALIAELEIKTEELEEETRYERHGKPFNNTETEILKNFLKDKHPTTYPEERAILDVLSVQLRRKHKSVKSKAISLGLQTSVDYWTNKLYTSAR